MLVILLILLVIIIGGWLNQYERKTSLPSTTNLMNCEDWAMEGALEGVSREKYDNDLAREKELKAISDEWTEICISDCQQYGDLEAFGVACPR